jgi:superfamily II DNA or RNA helicase
MWLKVGNLATVLTRATAEERAWLTNFLTFEDGKARFIRKMSASGSGKVSMFNSATGSFPTGLLPLVRAEARKLCPPLEVDLIDARQRPVAPEDVGPAPPWLRDYQAEAVERTISASRGILDMPTGAGKTQVFVALAMRLPCRWLFLVNAKDLLHQTVKRYREWAGEACGVLGDGECELDSRVVVASFQTLHRALAAPDPIRRGIARQVLQGAQGIVVDEVHTLPAETYLSVAQAAPNAFYRVGLSGTPLARGDRRSLLAIATTGPIIYRLPAARLIEQGVLAKPRIRMLKVHQPASTASDIGAEEYTWPNVYQALVVRSRARNQAVLRAAERAARPALLFVKDLAHGESLALALGKRGVRAAFVAGADASENRQELVRRLVGGELDVLVSSVIFQQGVDIPSLASVVVGSGGRSAIATIQRVGRGMRTDDGKKKEFEVWDVMDSGCPMLERHARARMRAYVQAGYETIVEDGAQVSLAEV